MCGRYALALVRQLLEHDGMPVAGAPADDGPGAARLSYNFAPGYHGIVYRADTPDRGAGPRSGPRPGPGSRPGPGDAPDEPAAGPVAYKLQAMRWGLIPFWTKRSPGYASVLRTINCRDDSLAAPGGMWASIKARKRCIVVAQGFFEWLRTGPKDKLPHYVKRADGRLMCFAGLWDCVRYEGSDESIYSYTIITTDSNKQLKFLHDRMPVIFDPGSDKMRTWLDPAHHEWSRELQALLRPFDGALDVYPVAKDVGKVGNNSPSFVIPLDSTDNKSNIANFFANARHKADSKPTAKELPADQKPSPAVESPAVEQEQEPTHGSPGKRKAHLATEASPAKRPAVAVERKKISATQNERRSPAKAKAPGSHKITKFFGSSA